MKIIIKIVVVIFLFFILPTFTDAQTDWNLEPTIKKNDYFLLEGKISDYPITMYLERTNKFCGEHQNNNWNARGLKGWYYYDKIKKKIPLVGAMKCSDPNYFTKIYVPENLLDTLNNTTCSLENYKELFESNKCFSFDEMLWASKNNNKYLPVYLNEKHAFSYETDVVLSFRLNGLELADFNLTELTENILIDKVEVVSKKELDANFYAIIKFSNRSNPSSNGGGQCGAGVEGFLGFIKINDELELEEFNFYETHSCVKYVEEGKYIYDVDFPEKGVFEKK